MRALVRARTARFVAEAARLGREVGLRFVEDRCLTGASALSYTSMISLVPITAIVLATFSGFPIFEEARGRFIDLVVQNIAPSLGGEAVTWIRAFAHNAARATVYGVLGLVVTSVLLLATIEENLHFIFRVTRHRRWGQRVLAYWTVITLGPLLIAVVLDVTGDIDHLLARLAVRPNVAEQAAQAGAAWLRQFTPVLIQTLAFASLYHLIPNRPLRWRDCLWGGVAAGLLLEVMRYAFGVFVSRVASYGAIYGALAGVPIVLVWMYIFWAVTLLGAELVAVLSQRRDTWPDDGPAGITPPDGTRGAA